jgi:hypothetical protein
MTAPRTFQLDLFTLRRRSLRVRRSLLRLLVDIGAADRLASAETQYWAAMTLAGQLGMRPLVARCQFGPSVVVRVLTRMASLLE